MKKIILLLLLIGNVAFAQHTAIPDPNFEQALIDLGYDDVIDGQVLTANIENVVYLDVQNKNIDDITGIEDFTALIELRAGLNNFTSIDLSQNVALMILSFLQSQPLTSLDVSANIMLEQLLIDCEFLSTVDISNNPNLLAFYSRGAANITHIDFSNNLLLEWVQIRSDALTELDFKNNPRIEAFECECNQLTSIDVSNLRVLEALSLTSPITSIDVSQNLYIWLLKLVSTNLSSVELSSIPELYWVTIKNNSDLENIDLRNGSNPIINLVATENPNLSCVYVDNINEIPFNWEIDANATYVETEAECDALSVEDFNAISFDLYPNPTKDFFTINSKTSVETISIHDISGKLIKTFAAQNEYDVSGFSKGLYLIKIKSEAGNSVEKLLID